MSAAGWRWPLAGAVSAALHGGVALGLAASLAPRPVPDQAPPAARLDLATYRVERSEAREADAGGEAAAERAAGATALSGGAVPTGRARPAALAPEAARPVAPAAAAAALPAAAAREARIPAAVVEGAVLAPRRPDTVDVRDAAPGARAATAVVATAAAAPALEPGAANAVPVAFRPVAAAPLAPAGAEAASVPAAGARAAAAAPAGEAAADLPAAGTEAPPAVPEAARARQEAARAARLAPAPPDAVGAAAVTPPAEAAPAALAWSGGADDEVDPVSLAAIQSFMREGDAAARADPVRDGIGGLLAAVPCARLQAEFDPATGALELRGHVPEEGLRAPVLEALRAQVGAAIPVADNLRILPRPQCGALSGIAAAALPQSAAQTRDPKVVGEGAHARVYDFREGERLTFELVGPDYPAVVYVDYFDAEGMVLHLQPNEHVPPVRVAAKEQVVIGAAEGAERGLSITVAPPFGQEIVAAFAASRPLFDGLRPIREPAGPYLEALAAAVAAARAADPGFRGEWVYFFVETRAH